MLICNPLNHIVNLLIYKEFNNHFFSSELHEPTLIYSVSMFDSWDFLKKGGGGGLCECDVSIMQCVFLRGWLNLNVNVCVCLSLYLCV